MISWQRALFLFSLAVIEVAPVALLVTLAGESAWALLLLIAIAGGVAGRMIERWLPEQVARFALLGCGLLLAFWAFKSLGSGDYGPLSGWQMLEQVAQARAGSFIAGLGALYVFWRGSRLEDHDSVSITQFFTRAMVVLVVVLVLGGLGGTLNEFTSGIASLQLLSFFAGGLLAIALANMADDNGSLRRADARGVFTLLAAIVLILLVGVFIASVAGGYALRLLGAAVLLMGQIAAFLLSPLAGPLDWLLRNMIRSLGDSEFGDFLSQMLNRSAENANEIGTNSAPGWISVLLNILCLVIPLAGLIALFLLAGKRRKRKRRANEERESLLDWQDVREDLLGLFRRKKGQGESSLQQTLAGLRGNDPVSRIRRAYLRMLIAAEQREQTRPRHHTPKEYAPTAQAALRGSGDAVASLTNAYERARYAPSSAKPTDAEQAERAWDALDTQRPGRESR